jgi:hypothetical protein
LGRAPTVANLGSRWSELSCRPPGGAGLSVQNRGAFCGRPHTVQPSRHRSPPSRRVPLGASSSFARRLEAQVTRSSVAPAEIRIRIGDHSFQAGCREFESRLPLHRPCAIGSRDALTGPVASSYPSPMPQSRRRRTTPKGRRPRAQRRGEALEGGDRPAQSLTGPHTAGADRRGTLARPVRAAGPARATGPGAWYAALFADLVVFLGCGLLAERLLPPTGRTVAWIVLIMTFGVGAGWLWGKARQSRRHPEARHE